MSDGLIKLQNIGAQKIHEKTHIARHNIQAILHESFEDMTKIQMQGFITILQREFDIDLSEYKAKVDEYYLINTPAVDTNEAKFFVTPTKKRNYTFVYVLIVIAIFGVAVYFTLEKLEQNAQKTDNHTIDNSAIKNAQQSMSKIVEEENVVLEEVEEEKTVEAETAEVETIEAQTDKPEVVEIVKSFKIIPNTKLWIGYVDLSNHRKYQKLFSDELELDPKKDWLLTLGHGNVKVEINAETRELNDKSNVRLLYKDSNLTQINLEEFKELNRGQKW